MNGSTPAAWALAEGGTMTATLPAGAGDFGVIELALEGREQIDGIAAPVGQRDLAFLLQCLDEVHDLAALFFHLIVGNRAAVLHFFFLQRDRALREDGLFDCAEEAVAPVQSVRNAQDDLPQCL